MLSKERIAKALSHQEADRIPIDLWGAPCRGITAIVYNKLKSHLGINLEDL